MNKIKSLKKQRFSSFQDLVLELKLIWKLEGADYNMIKNIFTFVFILIKEFQFYEKGIWDVLDGLIELAGTEKIKFITLFIISLEERESADGECFKETEYKA